MKESEWRALVVDLARTLGWRVYYTVYSLGAVPGFPDLVLCHPKAKRIIFAELKGPRTKLTVTQMDWLNALREAGAEVHVWRSDDLESVTEALKSGDPAD